MEWEEWQQTKIALTSPLPLFLFLSLSPASKPSKLQHHLDLRLFCFAITPASPTCFCHCYSAIFFTVYTFCRLLSPLRPALPFFVLPFSCSCGAAAPASPLPTMASAPQQNNIRLTSACFSNSAAPESPADPDSQQSSLLMACTNAMSFVRYHLSTSPHPSCTCSYLSLRFPRPLCSRHGERRTDEDDGCYQTHLESVLE